MEVNLIGYYTDGRTRIPHKSVEEFIGDWNNEKDHVQFRNSLFTKHFGLRIDGYVIKETPTTK